MAHTMPPAVRWLTYNGDAREWAETHPIVGPNTLNELLTAVDATYDEETNKTRVGFAYGIHRQEA